MFDGDVVDGLLEVAVEEDDVGLAVSLQVRASHDTKDVLAELEDVAHIALLLELHDFVMLKYGGVARGLMREVREECYFYWSKLVHT